MADRARSWEAARALARHLGEQVSAQRGEALWLRDYPAAAPGEIGRVVLGVARRSVHRSCAVVSDLGAQLTITVEEEREGTAVWTSFRGSQERTPQAVKLIGEAIEQRFGGLTLPLKDGGAELGEGPEIGELPQPRRELPQPRRGAEARFQPVTAASESPQHNPGEGVQKGLGATPEVESGTASELESESELRRRLRLLGALAAADQRPGLLDAGYALLDSLGQMLAVPEARWRLELWGEGRSAGGVSISLSGGPHAWEHLVQITADRRGALLRVPGAEMLAAEISLLAPTLAALAGLLGHVAALARAAVDGRATFRARTFSALHVAERLAAALRTTGSADDQVPHAHASGGSDEGFPARWPRATLVERLARDHLIAELEERKFAPVAPTRSYPNWDVGPEWDEPAPPAPPRPCVAVTIDGRQVHLFDDAELTAQLPELLGRARRLVHRLTPGRLGIDQIYEVLEPFAGLERGLRLRYAECHSDPRGEVTEYRFYALAAGRPLVSIVEYADGGVLRELHRYLKLVAC